MKRVWLICFQNQKKTKGPNAHLGILPQSVDGSWHKFAKIMQNPGVLETNTDLIKIYSVVIEILSVSCSVLLLVTADGGNLGTPNCKKKKKKKKIGFMQRSL